MREIKNKHIGCYGIIIKDEKIVLIKKACGGYLGKLDLPGGGMEHGEKKEETLKREIMEEAGLIVQSYKLLDVTTNTFKWQMKDNLIENLHHIGILFLVEASGSLKTDPDGIDSNGAYWYEIKKLKKEDLTPFTIYALEKLNYKLK